MIAALFAYTEPFAAEAGEHADGDAFAVGAVIVGIARPSVWHFAIAAGIVANVAVALVIVAT